MVRTGTLVKENLSRLSCSECMLTQKMKLNRHQAQSLRSVLFNSSFTTKNTQSTFPALKDRILTNNFPLIDLKYAHLHLINSQVKCPNKCLKVTKCFLEITTKRCHLCTTRKDNLCTISSKECNRKDDLYRK